MSRNLRLVLGVLLIGAAAWLVDALQLSLRAEAVGREGPRLEALLAARGALEVGVLEARAGLLPSFDPLNAALRSLRDAAPVAEALRARGARLAPAAAHLSLAAQALEREEPALERLKTDLALLRLSSRHLPRAADTLLGRAEADVREQRRSPLARELATLAALRSDAERREEPPVQEESERLEQGLSRVLALRSALDEPAREALDALAGHARAILDRRERVDRATRALVRSPVRAHLEAARAAYERGARSEAQRRGALEVLGALLALAGLLALASAVRESARGRSRSRGALGSAV